MKSILGYTATRLLVASSVVIVALLIVFSGRAFAGDCSDILLVFGRGSSQNTQSLFLNKPYGRNFKGEEAESSKFFKRFKSELDTHYPEVNYKAVSVHNFPEYNPYGYQAKGVFSVPNIHNMIQAEISWWPHGEYTDSVLNGKEETVGYVKDQIAQCPNQLIVLGGYSQGAQMIGDTLFDFTPEERERINAVALFGDPKFMGGTEGSFPFWKKSKPKPWKRGTASAKERGIADARVPYVPGSMKYKTYSWCFSDDFVCSGHSGLRFFSSSPVEENSIGHSRYKTKGIPEAVREITQDLSLLLYVRDKANGGVDTELGPDQPAPNTPKDDPIDVAFLVNTSGDAENLISKLRFHVDDVLDSSMKFHKNVQYGLVDFSEQLSGTDMMPRVNFRQDLAPYDGVNLKNTFVRDLSWGGNGGGGGPDLEDPHAFAIEKTVQSQSWRPEAKKHIVLFTDQGAKETQTVNICNSAVRANLMVEENHPCTSEQEYAKVDNHFGSFYCDEVTKVIEHKNCRLRQSNGAYYINHISRTLDDAVWLANTKGIAVSVVLHKPIDRPDVDASAVQSQLAQITSQTGGLYLEYEDFDLASFSDVVWQVHNHIPKKLQLTTYDTTKLYEAKRGVNTKPRPFIVAKENAPTIIEASSNSSQTFERYWWDFNSDGNWDKKTKSPSVEYVFKPRHNRNVLTVAGVENDEPAMSVTLPIKVKDYNGPATDPITAPEFNTSYIVDTGSTDVSVSWEVTDGHAPGVVFIGDQFGLPLKSAPYQNGEIVLPITEVSGSVLQMWLLQDGVASERHYIDIPAE